MPHFEVIIRKVKDMRGRRITGYRAHLDTRLGPSAVEASGKTPEEATENLRSKLTHALNDCQNLGVTIFTFRGFVGVIFRTTIEPDDKGNGQYGYQVVHPDGHVGCVHSGGTFKENSKSAELFIAQNLYPDTDVFAMFTSEDADTEYKSWLHFQTRYAEAREAGCSDTEAHSYAGYDPRMTTQWFEAIGGRIEAAKS